MADNEQKSEVQSVEPQGKLAPLVEVQKNVLKFTTKTLGTERAAEMATHVAIVARNNPQLANAINRSPDSFLAAYLASAGLDLMPNTAENLAYIIPYGDKVQFQLGYKGLIKLARRSGEILSISAELVFEGDDFRVQFGTSRGISHTPDFAVDRTDYKKVTHAYGVAKLRNGEDQFVVMTKDELNKIQSTVKSSSTDSPWKQWPERQAIKTVLKRLCQLLPSSTTDDNLQRAVALDSMSEGGKLKVDKEGNFMEGEVIELKQETVDRILTADSREELQAISAGLSVSERKLAAPHITARIKEL